MSSHVEKLARYLQTMFFFFFPQQGNKLIVSKQRQNKKGVIEFLSEIRRMRNRPNYQKFVFLTRCGPMPKSNDNSNINIEII